MPFGIQAFAGGCASTGCRRVGEGPEAEDEARAGVEGARSELPALAGRWVTGRCLEPCCGPGEELGPLIRDDLAAAGFGILSRSLLEAIMLVAEALNVTGLELSRQRRSPKTFLTLQILRQTFPRRDASRCFSSDAESPAHETTAALPFAEPTRPRTSLAELGENASEQEVQSRQHRSLPLVTGPKSEFQAILHAQ